MVAIEQLGTVRNRIEQLCSLFDIFKSLWFFLFVIFGMVLVFIGLWFSDFVGFRVLVSWTMHSETVFFWTLDLVRVVGCFEFLRDI